MPASSLLDRLKLHGRRSAIHDNDHRRLFADLRRIIGQTGTAADSDREAIDAVFRNLDDKWALLVRIVAVFPPLLAVVLGNEQLDGADSGRADIVDAVIDLEAMRLHSAEATVATEATPIHAPFRSVDAALSPGCRDGSRWWE